MVVIMCIFKQLGKYQVKDMSVYTKHLIDELLNLWVGITMYSVSRPIGKKEFQLCGVLVYIIHHAPRITHFCGM